MAIPQELADLLQFAKEAVHRHPKHDLNLGIRRRIWAALGPRVPEDADLPDGAGRMRRTHLAVESARKVLSVWEATFPADRTPHEAIAAAVDRLPGAFAESVRSLYVRLWDRCDEILQRDERTLPAAAAGLSAARALCTAFTDELFDGDAFDDAATDQDVDPDEMDATYLAAAALASGTVWDDASSSERRREFWEWWLAEAVPKAWAAVGSG